MANIFDYLDWRGDVPFNIDPFNEVDALALCELVYAPFDGLVPGPGLKEKISIEDLNKKFFEKFTEEGLMERTALTKLAPFIMPKMAKSKRFGGMKLAGFVNDVDAKKQTQFAVCSFYLPDGTIFVAFRGTDDTLVGWKEDFNMCFSEGTGGQLQAADYLNTNFARTMKKLRIGGHSKGGNFAVYGSTFCRGHIQDSILEVYNFDGPGFIPEVLRKPAYKAMINRVHKFIPEESIIGMLMYTEAKMQVVVSDAKGINQHDPMSWQIKRNKFEQVDAVTSSSVLIDEVIKKWAVQFDYETRAAFGDVFFSSLISSSGATRLSQITSSKVRSIASLTKEIQTLDPKNQALILDVFGKLVAAGGDSLKHSLLSKLPKSLIMRKNEK
ncbi:Protein of unknown function [Pseudobutyrivibrio ruminis]|uniref:DUF2974 domain-containing protein n=1 Tax=Pseudobutyrivibrio ruminis TaxID=46206 RepID=A0A1H7IHR9_9FIRM|nr:Mbeg1-like protein [Pseudobutyrivibrio ruminis]SEK61948.1 Protein of unknown function [Pseudobutyrivibrio ruminis]